LREEAHLLSKSKDVGITIICVYTVYKYIPCHLYIFVKVEEAIQTFQKGSFPTSRGTDNDCYLLIRDINRNVLEHPVVTICDG